MKGRERSNLVQGIHPWQSVKRAWLYSDLLPAFNGEPLSSGVSTDGSMISASAVPNCGAEKNEL